MGQSGSYQIYISDAFDTVLDGTSSNTSFRDDLVVNKNNYNNKQNNE